MAFLHADADSHCIYGMQRYGPTERAVALWGHEIAFSVLCLPFLCCAHWPFYTLKYTTNPRPFSPTGLRVRSCLIDCSGLAGCEPRALAL